MWLKKRSSLILNCLVKIYIDTHKPVSSGQLAPLVSLSAATVRKELLQLESYGFLFKPSHSSGRVPTNRAIKFYLRKVMEDLDNNIELADMPVIDPVSFEFTSLSDNFLSSLSDQTQNIGFLFLNSIFDLNFRKIKFIKVGPHRVMTVIQTLNDCTFSKIFTTIENYPEPDLREWGKILSADFRGRTLHNTFKKIRNRLFKEKERYKKIYKELYNLLSNEDLLTAELFFKGALNILDSDVVDPRKVKRVVNALEEKVALTNFLNDILRNGTSTPNIVFGSDTGISDLDDFILIFSKLYYSKNPIGNIGIIGPKFMPYPYAISNVERFSSYFSQILSHKPLEV